MIRKITNYSDTFSNRRVKSLYFKIIGKKMRKYLISNTVAGLEIIFSFPLGHMPDSMSFSIGHSYFLSDIKVMKCRVYRLIVTSSVRVITI